MRKRYNDDEKQPSSFWRFVRGVIFALLVSAGAVAVLSIYVLAPPKPPPEPKVVEEKTGPEMISGIEVSTQPAYTLPNISTSDDTGPVAASPVEGVADAPAPGTFGEVQLSGPALTINAAAFESEPGIPLVAVVLDDTAANPLLHELLFSTKLPLTIGVVIGGGGDRETATAARQAGFEVVAQLPFTAEGQPGSAWLEYSNSRDEAARRTLTMIQRLPMAVAASRPLAANTPPNAIVRSGIIDALAPLGFAYLDHGVASEDEPIVDTIELDRVVGISRYVIPAGSSAAAAVSVLDQAAIDAARRGGAVVFAAPDDQLIVALQLWGGEGSASAARLAPLSAVIRRQNGG